MNLAGTEYNLTMKALEIFVSGCNGPHCKGCHNESLWNFSVGSPMEEFLPKFYIADKLKNDLVRRIFIVGGEPLDQKEDELIQLLQWIRDRIKDDKELWLFTRYSYANNAVSKYLDFLKIGPFDPSYPPRKVAAPGLEHHPLTLGSGNQKLWKLRGFDAPWTG